MLKSLLLPLPFAACLGLFMAAALSEGVLDPSGVWLDENGEARIRIEHCERPTDRICGYLVWSKDTAGAIEKDDKNSDPRKKSRQVLGMQLILGLMPEGEKYVGEIYDADNGKIYDVKLWREDDGHLKVKGCVLKILCGSQTWTAVSDVAQGQLIGPGRQREWTSLRSGMGASAGHGPHKRGILQEPVLNKVIRQGSRQSGRCRGGR